MSSFSSSLLVWFFESTKQNTRPNLLLISFLEDKDKLNLIKTNKFFYEKSFIFPIQKKFFLNRLVYLNENKELEIRKTNLQITNVAVRVEELDLLVTCYYPFINSYSRITSLILKHIDINKIRSANILVLLQTTLVHLQLLDLSGNTFTKEGIILLCDVIKSKQNTLLHLGLGVCYIDQEKILPLCELLNTIPTNLTSLDLGYNCLEDAGVIALSKVLEMNNTKLTFIDLNNNKITSIGVTHFCNSIAKRTASYFTKIDFSSNQVGRKGIQALSTTLQKVPSLKSLNLYDTQEEEEEEEKLQILCEVLKTNSTVTSLNLGKNNIGTKGIFLLSQVLKTNSSNLTSLNLSNNPIPEEGFYVLTESLKTNKTVTELNLSKTNFDWNMDKRMLLVSNLLKVNTSLLNLKLSTNNIWEGGYLTELLETLKYDNSSLLYLDLSSNLLKNRAIIDIGDMLVINKSLKKVDLQNNIFAYSTINNLFESRKCATLPERIVYYIPPEPIY